jgi:hypothetical protein
MARSAIKKSDSKRLEKIQKEMAAKQEEMLQIKSGIESSIGQFICEKFGTHDIDFIESKINYYYDLDQVENAAKGQVVKNEDQPEYKTN